MLSSKDRKFSAPVFSAHKQPEDPEATHIVRSAEMDNIPEQVYISREEQINRIRSVNRSVIGSHTAAFKFCARYHIPSLSIENWEKKSNELEFE